MKEIILYISYDGMLEPLGQSQVVAYLEKLSPAAAVKNSWIRRIKSAKEIAAAGPSRATGQKGYERHDRRDHRHFRQRGERR